MRCISIYLPGLCVQVAEWRQKSGPAVDLLPRDLPINKEVFAHQLIPSRVNSRLARPTSSAIVKSARTRLFHSLE